MEPLAKKHTDPPTEALKAFADNYRDVIESVAFKTRSASTITCVAIMLAGKMIADAITKGKSQ